MWSLPDLIAEPTLKTLDIANIVEVEERDKMEEAADSEAAGAVEDEANNYGRTPLYWALQHGHHAIVEMLRKAGAKE